MGKITTLYLLMAGIHLLLYISGIIDSNNTLVQTLLNPTLIIVITGASSILPLAIPLVSNILSSLGLTSPISSGTTLISNFRFVYAIPFIVAITTMFGDGLIIYSTLKDISPYFALLILSPLFVVTSMTIYAALDSGLSI